MTPTEAEVEAFARKLAAETGWERYVDIARRMLEAAPTDAPVTDTLPAEAIEVGHGVTVKPLKWGAIGAARRIFSADTSIGEYTVEYYETAGEGIGWSAIYRDAYELGDYPTLIEAKAAAQSDYEARILSAIEAPSPTSVPDGQEAVAWRWRWKDQPETDGWCLSEADPRPVATPTRMGWFSAVQPLYLHPAPSDMGVEELIKAATDLRDWANGHGKLTGTLDAALRKMGAGR